MRQKQQKFVFAVGKQKQKRIGLLLGNVGMQEIFQGHSEKVKVVPPDS